MDDTIEFMTDSVVMGKAPSFELAIAYKREHEPGTRFNYNTAESQVLLELVRRVSGMDAADYLEDKLWRPLGMEHSGAWIIDRAGADSIHPDAAIAPGPAVLHGPDDQRFFRKEVAASAFR